MEAKATAREDRQALFDWASQASYSESPGVWSRRVLAMASASQSDHVAALENGDDPWALYNFDRSDLPPWHAGAR